MLFDCELAKQICRDMGIPFSSEQEGITVDGKKLPAEFCAAKLFHGEYDFDYEECFTDAPLDMPREWNQIFFCVDQNSALAA